MAYFANSAIRGYRRFERYTSGAGFPTFLLASLVFYKLLLLSFLLIPADNFLLGGFAEEFRVWCFGADPETGRPQVAYLLIMFLEPIVLGGIVLAVWGRPLRQALVDNPRSLWSPLASALLVVLVIGGALVGLSEDARGVPGDPPFPADGLRTHFSAPAIDLMNQDGDRVRLADFKGDVVMLTASYATCGHTCPLILAQIKRVMAGFATDELADLRVMSVTLDPEHDTQSVLATLAKLQQFHTPTYHLLTGDPDDVNDVLDDMNIARSRDPETGIIDHANLFLLVDRHGRLAYRFTLGETQERWLGDALRLLLGEQPMPNT